MSKIIQAVCILSMIACTYSIQLVHTEGTASDVADEKDSPITTVSAEIPVV